VGNSNGEHQVQETPGGPGSKDKEKAEKDQVVASAGKQNKAPKSGPPKMSRKVVPDKKTALRYSVPVHQEKKVTIEDSSELGGGVDGVENSSSNSKGMNPPRDSDENAPRNKNLSSTGGGGGSKDKHDEGRATGQGRSAKRRKVDSTKPSPSNPQNSLDGKERPGGDAGSAAVIMQPQNLLLSAQVGLGGAVAGAPPRVVSGTAPVNAGAAAAGAEHDGGMPVMHGASFLNNLNASVAQVVQQNEDLKKKSLEGQQLATEYLQSGWPVTADEVLAAAAYHGMTVGLGGASGSSAASSAAAGPGGGSQAAEVLVAGNGAMPVMGHVPSTNSTGSSCVANGVAAASSIAGGLTAAQQQLDDTAAADVSMLVVDENGKNLLDPPRSSSGARAIPIPPEGSSSILERGRSRSGEQALQYATSAPAAGVGEAQPLYQHIPSGSSMNFNLSLVSNNSGVSFQKEHTHVLNQQIELMKEMYDSLRDVAETHAGDLDEVSKKLTMNRELLRQMYVHRYERERQDRHAKLLEDTVLLGERPIYSAMAVESGNREWFPGKEHGEISERKKQINDEKDLIQSQRRVLTNEQRVLKKQGQRVTTAGDNEDDAKLLESEKVENAIEEERIFEQREIYNSRSEFLRREEAELEERIKRFSCARVLHEKRLKLWHFERRSKYNKYLCFRNRYQLGNLIGKGGFSEVYKGIDLCNMREVALKIHEVSPEMNESEKEFYVRHAMREADIQKALKASSIVQLYDVISISDNSFATVLEYCGGETLDDHLKGRPTGTLSEKEARGIVIQLMTGLKAMNRREEPIIHYDLKPSNLLYDRGVIKITDFGLSKIVRKKPESGACSDNEGGGKAKENKQSISGEKDAGSKSKNENLKTGSSPSSSSSSADDVLLQGAGVAVTGPLRDRGHGANGNGVASSSSKQGQKEAQAERAAAGGEMKQTVGAGAAAAATSSEQGGSAENPGPTSGGGKHIGMKKEKEKSAAGSKSGRKQFGQIDDTKLTINPKIRDIKDFPNENDLHKKLRGRGPSVPPPKPNDKDPADLIKPAPMIIEQINAEFREGACELTSVGCGTYWYLPLECFPKQGSSLNPNVKNGDIVVDPNSKQEVSNKVDVWSVGVIFYEMLYGKRPYGANMSQDKFYHAALKGDVKLEVEFPDHPKPSKECQDYIRRLLERNQDLRPSVFEACADPYLTKGKI